MAVIRAGAHAEAGADKVERAERAVRPADKPALAVAEKAVASDKPVDKPAEKSTEKPAGDKPAPAADKPEAASRGAGAPDRTLRARDTAATLSGEPDADLAAVPLRVADAGH